jgi:hypothetical protein
VNGLSGIPDELFTAGAIEKSDMLILMVIVNLKNPIDVRA